MKLTKGDFKGILKVLLIILLVAGAVGLTCFLFFKNLNKNNNSFAAVSEYVYSVEREELLSELNEINAKDNSNGRLTEAIDSLDNISNISKALAPYLGSYDINNKAIVKNLNKVAESGDACAAAVDEYLSRTADKTFDRSNVSKLYSALSAYLVDFSNMINDMNAQIEDASWYKQVDVKFAYIDCYTRVVSRTFSNLTSEQPITIIDRATIKIFDGKIKFNGTNLLVSSTNYVDISNFIKYYNLCDKDSFAKGLVKNLNDNKNLATNGSDLQKASYYFGVVFNGVA